MPNYNLSEFERNSLRKPQKGAHRLERLDRRADTVQHEQREMQAAMKRDGRKCRFAHCTGSYRGIRQPIDPAHVTQPNSEKHRGMGGDRTGGTRTSRQWVIALCRRHHELYDTNPPQIDIEPITSAGMDGPVAFYERNKETGRMVHIFTEPARNASAMTAGDSDVLD